MCNPNPPTRGRRTQIRGVITPLFSGVGIGVAFTSNKLELELLELDPQLESTPSLELAPQEEQEE